MSSLAAHFQLQTIATYTIQYLQFIDANGHAVQTLPEFAQDPNILIKLYRWMMLTKAFDTKAINLQRTGKMGTYPASIGQEAIAVAMGYALKPEDVFVTYYR